MSLAQPSKHLDFIEYFLNPASHQPGIPVDYISYQFYAVPDPRETLAEWQYSLFAQVDQFLSTVHAVEAIRKQFAPAARTDIDEIGSILPTDAPPEVEMPFNLVESLCCNLRVRRRETFAYAD